MRDEKYGCVIINVLKQEVWAWVTSHHSFPVTLLQLSIQGELPGVVCDPAVPAGIGEKKADRVRLRLE